MKNHIRTFWGNCIIKSQADCNAEDKCEALPGVWENKGTMTKYFRDQKAGNKFEINLGNKGTQANI